MKLRSDSRAVADLEEVIPFMLASTQAMYVKVKSLM